MHPSHRELTRIHYDGFCSHDFLFVFFAWSSAPSLPMKSSCSLMTWLSVISCVPRENLGFLSLCICSIFHLSLLEHPSCGVLLAWFHGCSFSRLWASYKDKGLISASTELLLTDWMDDGCSIHNETGSTLDLIWPSFIEYSRFLLGGGSRVEQSLIVLNEFN